MRQLKSISFIGALIALLLLVVGCGDTASTADDDQEQTTVTVEKTVAEKPPPKTEREVVPPSDDSAADSGSGSGSIAVPDVVGHDHQLAQDEMQAAGLYLLKEEDCTGQDRLLLYDRNWTVVEQDPAAGTKVSEDDTITLCSKQDEE
jgi:hypothetical protein